MGSCSLVYIWSSCLVPFFLWTCPTVARWTATWCLPCSLYFPLFQNVTKQSPTKRLHTNDITSLFPSPLLPPSLFLPIQCIFLCYYPHPHPSPSLSLPLPLPPFPSFPPCHLSIIFILYLCSRKTFDHCLWSYMWPWYSCSAVSVQKIVVVHLHTVPKFVLRLHVSLFHWYFCKF